MIGHDFRSAGISKSVTNRFGNGKGKPFAGPLKVCDVRWGVYAVLSRNGSISIQHARGFIETVIYPLKLQQDVERAIQERRVERERSKDYFVSQSKRTGGAAAAAVSAAAAAAAGLDEEDDDLTLDNADRCYLDIAPTSLCRVPNRSNTIAITDRRCSVKLIDISRREVVAKFGSWGSEPGCFLLPTAISTFMEKNQLFYCVGDSSDGQRLQIFDDQFQLMTSIGEPGPAPNQFRDIVSIASSNTSTYPSFRSDAEYPYDPSWYHGVCSHDDLEEHLYDESFHGNFVMGRRANASNTYDVLHVTRAKKVVHLIIKEADHETLIEIETKRKLENTAEEETTTTVAVKRQPSGALMKQPSVTAPSHALVRRSSSNIRMLQKREDSMKLPPMLKTKSKSKSRLHFLSGEAEGEALRRSQSMKMFNEETVQHSKVGSVYIVNQTATPKLYACINDLVRDQRKFNMTGERRPYAMLALVDRGNFRVQIYRLYWTKSSIYRPELQLCYIVGGAAAQYVELIEPVAAAFSPTGELAICDIGAGKVLLLSRYMEIIKRIDIRYYSPADELAEARAKDTKAKRRTKLREKYALSEELVTIDGSDNTTADDQAIMTNFDWVHRRNGALEAHKVSLAARQVAHHAAANVGSPGASGGGGAVLSPATAKEKQSLEPSKEDRKLALWNSKPCWVHFTAEGNMIIGYKSGGIYIFSSYSSFAMGDLSNMQVVILERIIRMYLTYHDVEQLRNCCTYLHNFTRDMRMQWQLAPPPRDLMINMVLYLFIKWSRIDEDGVYAADFRLEDMHGQQICERHLLLKCQNPHCQESHAPILYSREDLASIGTFITYDDFLFFVSKVFGAKFIWKNEVYIKVLFDAFSKERLLAKRIDPMSRKNEVIRQRDYHVEKVLYFMSYMEIMATLEEDFSQLKPITTHKLFTRKPRTDAIKLMQQDIDTIDKRIVQDPAEQYDRSIDVPFKSLKGRKFITMRGMESAQRCGETEVKEHIDAVDRHTERATDMLLRLFS